MSIIRNNLLMCEGYIPYCGSENCQSMTRGKFNGTQFTCPECGWVSGFDVTFIKLYKRKWSPISCNSIKCVYNELGKCYEPDVNSDNGDALCHAVGKLCNK